MASKTPRWNAESGILRKKVAEEDPQDLLVFGYSCKLFRDDERAKLIDQGKHLIPWMGDSTLKIDRYDARGALGDLRLYEPPPGGTDYRTILTEEELRIEQTCDEERYRSLYNNEEEELLYHEEEIKRLHQALGKTDGSYNQVGFSYNDEKSNVEDSQSPKPSEDSNEDDEPFVAESELEIPKDMIVPETKKLNAIIVKTALFISHQGSQMEILIRAKQANNPQFSFLSIDGELHPYYKHILEAIKSGKYNPEKEPEKEEPENEVVSDEDDDDGDTYLHPSLASSLKVESAPNIPSINYRPSKDCAYSMLVNKITGKPPTSNQLSPQPQEQSLPQADVVPPPPMPPYGYYPMQGFQPFPSLPQQYTHGPVLYSSNGNAVQPPMLSTQTSGNPPLPPTSLNQTPQKETVSLVPYGPTPPKPLSRPSFIVPPADIQIIIDKMASYVAKNGRDFESIVKSKGDPRFNFLELSHQYHGYYAHKLAIYEGGANPRVLTEEEMLQKQEQQEEKKKKLEELQKKQQRMEEVQKRVKMIQEKKKSETGSRDSPGKQVTTVSFSIKKPKEGENIVIEKRNALPIEESDEEAAEDKNDSNSKTASPTSAILEIERIDKEKTSMKVRSTKEAKPSNFHSENKLNQCHSSDLKVSRDAIMPLKDEKSAKEVKLTISEQSSREPKVQNQGECSIEDSLPQPVSQIVDGDFVDLTVDSIEETRKVTISNKQEHDKNKQKMLILARKKLAALREKQLQLERRKKAAMFLSQIKSTKTSDKTEIKCKAKTTLTTKQVEAEPKDQPFVTSLSTSSNPQFDIDDLITANSLINKLREAAKKTKKRSKSSSTSESSSSGSDSSDHSEKRRSHKKHKKKKSLHKRSYRESGRSSRSHKSKKSKKFYSRHRSRSRSSSRHHSSRHKRESTYSDSDTGSS